MANIYVHSGETSGYTSGISAPAGSGLYVESGGLVWSATASGANTFIGVSKGGKVSSAFLRDGGFMYNYGVANYVFIYDNARMYISNGGSASGGAVFSGGVLYDNDGSASGFYVHDTAKMYVGVKGYARETKVNAYGSLTVSSGGSIFNTVLSRYGKLYVSGRASATEVNGSMYVYSGGSVFNAYVYGAGSAYVYRGGFAGDITLKGGSVFLSSGAVLSKAKVETGDLYVSYGGIAHSATVENGRVFVESTGLVTSTTLSGGTLTLDGGVASTTRLEYASMCVSNGGIARETFVNDHGVLYVSSGGQITSTLTIAATATVSAYQGSIIDFYIAQTYTPASFAGGVNDLSLVKGDPTFTVTIRAAQTNGTYKLAEGAAFFDKAVTIKKRTGETVGAVAYGDKLVVAGSIYSLGKTGQGALTMTVEASTSTAIPVGDLNADGRADIVMTISKTGHGAYGATGAWLIQYDQTAAWGDLSQRNSGWEIFGMGTTVAGKYDNDVYLRSADNVIGAWQTDVTGKVTGWVDVGSFDANTQVLGLGDFNGDRKTDLLLRNVNGAVGCYLTAGTVGWNYFQSLGDEWKICAVGDLNGDGRDDVVLKHDAGFAGSWLTQSDCTMKWADLDTLPSGYEIVGCGDFNGDGTDDVLLKKGNYYGAWIVQNGNAAGWMGLGDLGGVSVEQIADFDADGIDDLRIRTAAGDLGAQLVKGADTLQWKYYGSVGAEWSTSLAAI